jgi:(p)ppGpp synthase/HD superfamily hydrolase
MAEENVELRGEIVVSQSEAKEVAQMYTNLRRKCEEAGLRESWEEIKDCAKMVDASMTKQDNEGRLVRKTRGNDELGLTHPMSVASKSIDIAKRHPDLVTLNDELVEAALFHDFFEDFDKAVGVFNVRYPGSRVKAIRVMGVAMDVTKATALDRRVDDETEEQFAQRKSAFEAKMSDKAEKIRVKDDEDTKLLENVTARAEAGDFRPMVIKIADRIHNLETIGGLKPEAIDRTLAQTRAEFIPLAIRFGLIKEAEEMMMMCNAAAEKRLNNTR